VLRGCSLQLIRVSLHKLWRLVCVLCTRNQVEQHVWVVSTLSKPNNLSLNLTWQQSALTIPNLADGVNQQTLRFLVLSQCQVTHRQTVQQRHAGTKLVNQLLECVTGLDVLFAALPSQESHQLQQKHAGSGPTDAAFTHALASCVNVDSSSTVCMRLTCFWAKSKREMRTKIWTVSAILQTRTQEFLYEKLAVLRSTLHTPRTVAGLWWSAQPSGHQRNSLHGRKLCPQSTAPSRWSLRHAQEKLSDDVKRR
jgi:hypothetical protein